MSVLEMILKKCSDIADVSAEMLRVLELELS